MSDGLPLLPSDLLRSPAIWLLEIEWAGVTYRFTDEPGGAGALVITDANGIDLEYRGGIDVSWISEFSLFSESSTPREITFSELWFDSNDDIPARVAAGHDLSAMKASLYRWVDGVTYEDKHGVFFGISRQPAYGANSEPVSVTFESPEYRDGSRYPEGRIEDGQITVDDEYANGEAYPVIFGGPGGSLDATSSQSAGAPAHVLVASSKELLAGVLYASSVDKLWSITRDAEETKTIATETDLLGRRITKVTSTSASFVAGDEYGIEYTSTDGTGIGAGELLELLARKSTLRVDWGRMGTVRSQLNEFRLAGYIDSSVKAWQFAQRDILPLLPASDYHTPNGIAVRVWNDLATSSDALATLVSGENVDRVSQVQYESQEVINEITIRYAPGYDGSYLKTRMVTGRPGQGTAPEVILNPYAQASVSRLKALDADGPLQGVRSKVIDTPYVYDDSTATRIASWMIRARSSPVRSVMYEDVYGHLEWLDEADHVLLTDSDLSLTNQLCMVRGRAWSGGVFRLDLVLIDDILQR